MDEIGSKNYPSFSDITEESLGDNHSLKKILRFIEPHKHIVDFGCATGYLAQLLTNKGCTVTGIDINWDAAEIAKQYCEEVIVADLDFVTIQEILPDRKFDVAVFGDVLEHLRDPWKVLKEVKHILNKDGYVVASIPNIAHGDIRLALLQGKFEYTELGILDNTHLRFFTRKTVEELFEKSGYILSATDCTKLSLFSDNNLTPEIRKEEINIEIIQEIEQDPDIDTLQFIVKAVPSLQSQLEQTQVELERSHSQLQQTQVELERSHSQLEQTQVELERSQSQLQQAQSELERSQSQLEQTQVELERSQSQLQQAQSELERSQSQLQQTQVESQRFQNAITAMESSVFWRIRRKWFNFRHAIGLVDDNHSFKKSLLLRTQYLWSTFRLKRFTHFLKKFQEKFLLKFNDVQQSLSPVSDVPLASDLNYQKWLNLNYPTKSDLQKMANQVNKFTYQPIISILMPVFNTPEVFLKEAIESVLNQIYPYWELCIADDASTANHIKKVLKEYSSKDKRIKVVYRNENGHISLCSNSALEIATGEFVTLLDHDDILTPDALYEIALLLNKHPGADMIYSDEDKIDENGKLTEPFFKPDWCPDSFLSRMYTCHLGTYRTELIKAIGGFRVGFEGSQDYDLVLRFTEKTNQIFHIPKILYHWRIHPQSAASKADQKPYALTATEKALLEALARRGEPGQVKPSRGLAGHYIIRYEITDYKLVSIIIPTRDLGDTLDKCLTSIFEKTVYPNYEVILIDNGSQEENTHKVISKWQQRESNRFRCDRLDIPFNYSTINNYAVNHAKGDYLLFLNNDIEIITPDWIDAMVEQAQRPTIGAVGALLLYPDDTIQHAGVVIGIGGVAGHSHKHYPGNSAGYFNQVLTVNNYSAVTAACLMCRREVFEAVGGFEEALAVAFNDVDLCLKIIEKGYRNIYLPHVIMYHYESKSRGYEDTPAKLERFMKETKYMQNKWTKIIDKDPCYSPHLSKKKEDFSLNI